MDGYELWVDGCFEPCRDGWYRYGYNCEERADNCKKCVGGMAHECLECNGGFKLDPRGVCMRTCDDGEFPSLNGKECTECNEFCQTCIDKYETSCTSCFDTYYLRVLEPLTGSGQCRRDCPEGYFRD